MGGLSFATAFALRLDTVLLLDPPPWMLLGMLSSALTVGAVSLMCGLHDGIWRYASTADLVTITKVATISTLLFLLPMYLASETRSITPSVPAIQWLLLVVMMGGSRFALRLWYESWARDILPTYRPRRCSWSEVVRAAPS